MHTAVLGWCLDTNRIVLISRLGIYDAILESLDY
jgi:hypothetical protein